MDGVAARRFVLGVALVVFGYGLAYISFVEGMDPDGPGFFGPDACPNDPTTICQSIGTATSIVVGCGIAGYGFFAVSRLLVRSEDDDDV